MIRDNLSKFNLMNGYDNETTIGYYRDLIPYFKEVAKEYIDKLDIEEWNAIEDIIDLVERLNDDYNRGQLGNEDLLEIGYNPMGSYTYCKLVREKE